MTDCLNHLDVWKRINNVDSVFCLMAYNPFLGYLMPKPAF